MNTFGKIFQLTSFGESHGPAMGGVIDGLPSGTIFNMDDIREFVARRRPGSVPGSTSRREADQVEFLSGLMSCQEDSSSMGALRQDSRYGIALGTPVGFVVHNNDMLPAHYDELRHVYRPSHGDYAWEQRYGVRDWRGGGRCSGRETISRVVAGAFAMQILRSAGVMVSAKTVRIGGIDIDDSVDVDSIVNKIKSEGNSLGGIVECRVVGLPAGVGEPTFGKLDQAIAGALMSIGAVKGVEFGAGFAMADMLGSEAADCMDAGEDGSPFFLSNHSGGIQGGISNGSEIVVKIAVKPTPSIAVPLKTITDEGCKTELRVNGRHDAAVVLRVTVVAEAMVAMVIADMMMLRNASRGLSK